MAFERKVGQGNFSTREYRGPNGERMIESTLVDAQGQAHTNRYETEAVSNLPPNALGVIEMKDGSRILVNKDGSVHDVT